MPEGTGRKPTKGAADSETDFARLRRVALFQGLSEPSLRTLLADASVRRVDDGTVLFVQGDEADQFFVLLDGWVKLYRLTEEGAEALVTVVAPGETFAEAAMFAQQRYPVCAEAIAASSMLVIGRGGFAASLAADPQIALLMLGSLSKRMRHLVERIEQLQVKSAPQRLGDFLVRLCTQAAGPATVELPFAKGLVAQRLGMRPETLSRAMGALRRVGVTARGGRVAIDDVARLRAFCDAPRGEEPGLRGGEG